MTLKMAALAPTLLAVVLAPPAAADPGYLAFASPSQNISCEIDYQRGHGIPDVAFCATITPPESVSLDDSGVLSNCSGENCVGNGPQGAPRLAYGETSGTGPFTCRSEAAGITCTVTSGHGFAISSSGITPVG